MVIEELLSILLRLERLDVCCLDPEDYAAALSYGVPLAICRVNRKKELCEVRTHHNVLAKDLLEVLKVVIVVL